MEFGKYLYYRSGTSVTRSPHGLFYIRSPWDLNPFSAHVEVSRLIYKWRTIVYTSSSNCIYSVDAFKTKKCLELKIEKLLAELKTLNEYDL